MEWVKRNLFFVIGAAVALLLIGVAGYYSWSGYSKNSAAREELNTKYEELRRFYESQPSPGDGEKVDNIKRAKDQAAEVRAVIGNAGRRFQRPPPIVVGDTALEGTNISIAHLSRGMSETIARLQREATNSGVILLPRYNFSFEAEADKVRLAPAGLPPLAEQLSEVKVIADVLIDSKVNSIDAIQRERVAQEDYSGIQTDYIEARSKTNELAIITPYQVTFRSFTPELGAVLSGYANSPYGIVVRRINVEPAVTTTMMPDGTMPYTPPQTYYTPPPSVPPTGPRYAEESRYGPPGGGLGGPGYQRPPGYAQPCYPPAAPAAPVAAPASTVPKTVLNEKQIKVQMQLEIIKLLPVSSTPAPAPAPQPIAP